MTVTRGDLLPRPWLFLPRARTQNPWLRTTRAREVYVFTWGEGEGECQVEGCDDAGLVRLSLVFGPGTAHDPDSATLYVNACVRHAVTMYGQRSEVYYLLRGRVRDAMRKWLRA